MDYYHYEKNNTLDNSQMEFTTFPTKNLNKKACVILLYWPAKPKSQLTTAFLLLNQFVVINMQMNTRKMFQEVQKHQSHQRKMTTSSSNCTSYCINSKQKNIKNLENDPFQFLLNSTIKTALDYAVLLAYSAGLLPSSSNPGNIIIIK